MCPLIEQLARLTSTGVKSYNVSLDKQEADIVTEDNVTYDDLLGVIKKVRSNIRQDRDLQGYASNILILLPYRRRARK